MKPALSAKLHVKIFVSCLLILLAVEVLIFFIFKPIAVRHMNSKILDFIEFRSYAFQDLIVESVRNLPSEDPDDVRVRRLFITGLAKAWSARIWVTDRNGETLLRSFDGEAPFLPEDKLISRDTLSFSFLRQTDLSSAGVEGVLFVRGVFQAPEGTRYLFNVLFEELDKSITGEASTIVRWTFLIFLGGIAFGVALLLFPVAFFISRPLRSLDKSVTRIAEGNFSQRVNVTTRDEIGELGTAVNRMAETIERMISSMQELITNISHELRTPLSRIRIALEILGEKLKKKDRNEFQSQLDSVHEDIEDIDRLVDRILELSKLDIKKASSGTEEVNISEIAETLLDKFSAAIQRKSISLEATVEPGVVLFQSCEEDIRAAFSNLLDNAVRYTPEGGRIDLEVKRLPNRIETNIANTCEPLTDEQIRRLFDPFFRSNPTETSGTGLGLAITRKIVENAGGRIEASRWQDHGLRIRLLFLKERTMPA